MRHGLFLEIYSTMEIRNNDVTLPGDQGRKRGKKMHPKADGTHQKPPQKGKEMGKDLHQRLFEIRCTTIT